MITAKKLSGVKKKKNDIYKYFKQGGFDVLIDECALFRNEKKEEVLRNIKRDGFTWFYINEDGKAVSEDGLEFEDGRRDAIVYFDQKHTRGTDVRLKKNAKALVIMNKRSTLSSLSQAIFRLRNLKCIKGNKDGRADWNQSAKIVSVDKLPGQGDLYDRLNIKNTGTQKHYINNLKVLARMKEQDGAKYFKQNILYDKMDSNEHDYDFSEKYDELERQDKMNKELVKKIKKWMIIRTRMIWNWNNLMIVNNFRILTLKKNKKVQFKGISFQI